LSIGQAQRGRGPEKPILHVLAGPNGAGKSTLYNEVLKHRHPSAPFVNADDLARGYFGHPAQTLIESQIGQRLADEKRDALLAARESFFTETTFSHPSKLELLHNARALGYEVRVYHVNVRNSNLSVLRVAARVVKGGHDVPQDKIHARYVRNQALIRDAVRYADKAIVFDNSATGQPPSTALILRHGRVTSVASMVPRWARELYADDLTRYTPERVNAPAASFKDAERLAAQVLGAGARVFVAKRGGRYTGDVIGTTALHVVQRLNDKTAVAHFANRLERQPEQGDSVAINYGATSGLASVRSSDLSRDLPATPTAQPNVDAVLQRLAVAAKTLGNGQGGVIESALEQLRAGRQDAVRALLTTQPVVLNRFTTRLDELGIRARSEQRSRGIGR